MVKVSLFTTQSEIDVQSFFLVIHDSEMDPNQEGVFSWCNG